MSDCGEYMVSTVEASMISARSLSIRELSLSSRAEVLRSLLVHSRIRGVRSTLVLFCEDMLSFIGKTHMHESMPKVTEISKAPFLQVKYVAEKGHLAAVKARDVF